MSQPTRKRDQLKKLLHIGQSAKKANNDNDDSVLEFKAVPYQATTTQEQPKTDAPSAVDRAINLLKEKHLSAERPKATKNEEKQASDSQHTPDEAQFFTPRIPRHFPPPPREPQPEPAALDFGQAQVSPEGHVYRAKLVDRGEYARQHHPRSVPLDERLGPTPLISREEFARRQRQHREEERIRELREALDQGGRPDGASRQGAAASQAAPQPPRDHASGAGPSIGHLF